VLSTLKAGTVVDSRYEIVEHLGDGGMGSVFKARELGLERFVALKMLHPSLIGDSEHRERFKREGALLSALEHPHIIRCFRFGLWKETFPYIAMEFLSGESLTRVIGEDNTCGPARVLTIAKQICDAMQYAHESKIIHRDLKPANIMLIGTENQEFVKVLDFGLARLLPDPNQVSQHLTQTGELIGSVYYMSPEQCLGKKSDTRSDIYSLGCLLYEALTGAPPLVADTPVGLIYRHVNDYPAPLENCLKGTLPPGLNSVLMQAMAKNPKDRYQSMSELKADLELVAAGRGNEIPVFSAVREKASVRKSKLPFYLVGSSVVALLVLAMVCFFNRHESVSISTDSAASPGKSRRFISSGDFTQSPLFEFDRDSYSLTALDVKKLEQGTARLQRFIESGKDTAPESSANAMVGKLMTLESAYWSRKRYDDWYALTERLLRFELIAAHRGSGRIEHLAETAEGTYWLSVKTSGLPEGARWKERFRQCRERLKELENRSDSPQAILTLRLTNSVQFGREGLIPEARDELDKALKDRDVLDLLSNNSSAGSCYLARARVERTMYRLMDSTVCRSPEDVVTLCQMLLRLRALPRRALQDEGVTVTAFCREQLEKAFPDGVVPSSLRSSYQQLNSQLNAIKARGQKSIVARKLEDLPSNFDYWNAEKRDPKVGYFAEWLDKYGKPESLSSVRAHCYLGLLYSENYEAALEHSKLAVSEFA